MPLQKWSEEIWISQLSPEPAFSEEMDVLALQYAGAEEPPHLVLDLSEVEVLNSSNLSQMLRLRKIVSGCSRRVRVAGPSDAVRSLLRTTGLDKVFELSQDTATALAELQLGG